MCIKDLSQKILSVEIIMNVMEEMRMERKIRMVIQNKEVD